MASARCPAEVLAAVLEMETSGGRNIYGHDAGACMSFRHPWRDVEVTKENYTNEYLPCIRAGGKRNGVGPMQLTWGPFQEEADARGGCWDPKVSTLLGAEILGGYLKVNSVRDSFSIYNTGKSGSSGYATKAMPLYEQWLRVLGGTAT